MWRKSLKFVYCFNGQCQFFPCGLGCLHEEVDFVVPWDNNGVRECTAIRGHGLLEVLGNMFRGQEQCLRNLSGMLHCQLLVWEAPHKFSTEAIEECSWSYVPSPILLGLGDTNGSWPACGVETSELRRCTTTVQIQGTYFPAAEIKAAGTTKTSDKSLRKVERAWMRRGMFWRNVIRWSFTVLLWAAKHTRSKSRGIQDLTVSSAMKRSCNGG